MDESLIRANFKIAGYVELHDLAGRPWTVMLRRPGDRPGGSRWGSWALIPQMGRTSVTSPETTAGTLS